MNNLEEKIQSILSNSKKGAIFHNGEWLIGQDCHLEIPEQRRIAQQICQLFEQEDEVDPRQVVRHGGEVDDSKLTDEEIVRAIHGFSIQGYQGDLVTERDRKIAEAQDAKAASRMRAKFQTAFTEEIK